MNNHHFEDKFTLHSTYVHSTNSKDIDNDDNVSIGSYFSSQFTKSSGFSSTVSSQRINQIEPKHKLVLNRTKRQEQEKKLTEKQSKKAKNDKIGIQWSSLATKKYNLKPIVQESITYNTLKPFISLNKLNFLCGMEQKLGENGCLCQSPCLWKKNWTKHYESKDLIVYKRLLDIPALKQNETQIIKDLPRTHPECPTFSQNKIYREMLRQVLIAYSVYDIEIGYVQGLNMIAGVLLYHIKNSQQTFWAFVEMMEYQELRMIYLYNFVHLRAHCEKIKTILHSKVNDLSLHMTDLDLQPDCFLNGWFLSLMGTCIPLEFMHQVIDKFRAKGWAYIYKLIITYLLFLKEYLLMADDQAQFLNNLNTQNSRQLGVEWREMIQNAQKLTF